MFTKESKKKKGSKKKIVAGIVAVAVVGTAGSVVYTRTQRHDVKQSGATEANSAEVSKGNISKTIVGTGNLAADTAESITIPSGLTVSEVYVESGDQVSAGTVLATVEKSSVLSAVEDVQKEIDELDEKISTCQSNTTQNKITSSVAGRVKAIYVSANSKVTDVMVENGALIKLSLDGLMAVKLDSASNVSTGDTVTVKLSSGTTVKGKVESVDGDSCVVTLTDNGTTLGDTVTVTNSDGTTLGTGELYIHDEFDVTGTTGTVYSVSVSENQKVSSGTKLMVLNGTESDSEYEELMATREARTETLQKLLSLTQDPQIKAEQDGTVQSVNVSASQTTSSDSSSNSSGGGTTASQMSYTKSLGDVKFVNLSSEISLDDVELDGSGEESGSDTNTESGGTYESSVPSGTAVSFSIANDGSSDSSKLVIPAPVKGNTPVTDVSSSDGSYSGVVTWNPADSTFAASTSYKALVVLTAADGYYFTADSVQSGSIGTVSGIQVGENGKTLEFQIVFPETASDDSDANNNKDNNGDNTDTSKKDTDQNNDNKNSGDSDTKTGDTDASTNGAAGGTGTGSASGDGVSSSDGQGSASQTSSTNDSNTDDSTSSNKYSTDVTAFTVSPDENMCLSVSVDELDINSVEVGQTASVTFDAIENETFEGTVTKIGNTASVNGGVAKYTVELTIPKDSQMKQGMNASATITIEERDDVLTLPANALQEKGDKTFVYTEKSDDGTLSGETEVTTGLSDGNTVEITDGLSEGDTVYYQKSESSSSSSSDSSMSDMGDMPDMGGDGGSGGGPGGGGDGGSGGGPGGGGSGGGPGM